MSEIDIKRLQNMIQEIVRDEIDNHRHGCTAARDADFLERSVTPSKIRISEYNEYKDKHDKENEYKIKKRTSTKDNILQVIGLIILFVISCGLAIGWRFLNG